MWRDDKFLSAHTPGPTGNQSIPGLDDVKASPLVKLPDSGLSSKVRVQFPAPAQQPGKPEVLGEGHLLLLWAVAPAKVRRVREE